MKCDRKGERDDLPITMKQFIKLRVRARCLSWHFDSSPRQEGSTNSRGKQSSAPFIVRRAQNGMNRFNLSTLLFLHGATRITQSNEHETLHQGLGGQALFLMRAVREMPKADKKWISVKLSPSRLLAWIHRKSLQVIQAFVSIHARYTSLPHPRGNAPAQCRAALSPAGTSNPPNG